MKAAFLLFCLLSFQQEIPFKPKEQFEIKLDFKFKQRVTNSSLVELDRSVSTTTGTLLPYLYVNINVLKLDEGEIRMRIENSQGQMIYNKKVEPGDIAKLDLGFTDDIKDGISSRQYEIYFISKDKKRLSRISIAFEKDGTYLVNGEKRGRL
jgi:hypothetical protein